MNAPKPQHNPIEHAYESFLEHHLSTANIAKISNSSFLDIITIAYFIGARDRISEFFSAPKENNFIIKAIHCINSADSNKAEAQYRSVLRLIDKFILLEQICDMGRQSAAEMLNVGQSNVKNKTQLLSNILDSYSNYSMVNLSREGITDTYQKYMERATVAHTKIAGKLNQQKTTQKISTIIIWIFTLTIIVVGIFGIFLLKNTHTLEDKLQPYLLPKQLEQK